MMEPTKTLVRKYMTPDPQCVTPHDSIRTAARLMEDCCVGALPVVTDMQSNKLVGLITIRDMAMRCIADSHDPDNYTVEQVMSTPAHACSPETTLSDCERLMRKWSVRRIPVVRGSRCVGIISFPDIATRRLWEETGRLAAAISRGRHCELPRRRHSRKQSHARVGPRRFGVQCGGASR